ncbi:hypothetical protein GCM10027059_12570 [Myceligenerans halotolerans]
MSSQVQTAHRSAPAWANLVAAVFEPANVVSVTVITMGLATATGWKGVGHAAAALVFCALVPAAAVYGLSKVGILESRWIRPRAQRFVALLGVVVLEVIAVAILVLLGASDLLIRMLIACVAGVIALTAVTPVIRASIHVGALTVTAGVMTQVLPGLTVALLALAVIVASARLAQKEHTPLEVATGYLWGFASGALAAWPLLG